ncbi:MAG: transporter substrate-binding domain-containing protein [Gammaproteobacteria bacterium]|nr:transporter substrate-binding domain-containing protein [Gammaproteobacteria bacterium]
MTASAGPQEQLIVGTRVGPPLVIDDGAGDFDGITIELWRRVAADLGIDYEFRETSLAGLISGLENGSIDVSAAALTVTPEREARLDSVIRSTPPASRSACRGKARPGSRVSAGFSSGSS